MRKYSLLLPGGRSAEEQWIEFEAENPAAALKLAEDQGADRTMELWEGDTLLGTIKSINGFWSLSKA